MRIPIDRDSPAPLYQQVESFLRKAILSQSLVPGTRLPSTRHLARDLGVNRITIENAYACLEVDGLIAAREGSGTYVLAPAALPALPVVEPGQPWPLWQQDRREWLEKGREPSPDELLRAAGHPRPISFATGSGDARLFPVEEYRRVIQTVLRRDGMEALGYGDHFGYGPLRATIAHILGSQGIPARPDSILVTGGSQQAIALVAQLILRPGDTILVESPTYALALDLFRALRLRIVGVPLDENGMQVEKLEKALQQHHPRLIYAIPNFHNPTGVCMSLYRRRQLLALADRYNLPILEDDYVGDLRYEGKALPALKSLDPGGRVIYASTFSKMLMPGLRVGFLAADGPVYADLANFKHFIDLTTSNLHQRALEAYVTVGRYQAHLRRSSQLYRRRRDAMLESIHCYLPAGAGTQSPQGGLFLWVRLPEDLRADELLPLAVEEGVAFSLGDRFFAEGTSGEQYIRLNFASQPPELIQEGIQRLGKVMRKVLKPGKGRGSLSES